jgi:hypothetical protein
MLTPEEFAELRALQRRAYAPGGGLDGADAARLADLEERHRMPAPPASATGSEPSSDSASTPADVDPSSALDQVSRPDLHATEAPAATEAASPRRARRFSRRRVPVLLAAAVLVGLGAGWMLFEGTVADGMRALAHADERTQVEAQDDFDAGSVSFVDERDGVTVWHARKSEPELQQCMIIQVREQITSQCLPDADVERYGSLAVGFVIDGDEEGSSQQVSATIIVDASGKRVALIQAPVDLVSFDTEYVDVESGASVEFTGDIAPYLEVDWRGGAPEAD